MCRLLSSPLQLWLLHPFGIPFLNFPTLWGQIQTRVSAGRPDSPRYPASPGTGGILCSLSVCLTYFQSFTSGQDPFSTSTTSLSACCSSLYPGQFQHLLKDRTGPVEAGCVGIPLGSLCRFLGYLSEIQSESSPRIFLLPPPPSISRERFWIFL